MQRLEAARLGLLFSSYPARAPAAQEQLMMVMPLVKEARK